MSKFLINLDEDRNDLQTKTGFVERLYTRSPFIPCLPWLAPCGRWNFLWDMNGVHWIHTLSSLFVYVLIC